MSNQQLRCPHALRNKWRPLVMNVGFGWQRLTVWVTNPGANGSWRLSKWAGLDCLEGDGLSVHTHWGSKDKDNKKEKQVRKWVKGWERSEIEQKSNNMQRCFEEDGCVSNLRRRWGGKGSSADLLWILNPCKRSSVLLLWSSGNTKHNHWLQFLYDSVFRSERSLSKKWAFP